MAPAQGVSVEGAAPAGAWSIFKPLSWPQGKKKFKAAHEGEKMRMFYDPVAKKWVEKGMEAALALDPGNAPPPILLPSTAPVPNSYGTAARNNRTRRPITERYARQNNLGVSSSLDNLGRTASAPLPPCSFISPPASTSNFFIPGPSPTSHDLPGNTDSTYAREDAAPFSKGISPMASEPASPASNLLDYPCSSSFSYSPTPAAQLAQVMPPSTPPPADSFHHSEATACATTASDSSSSAALPAMGDMETLLGVPAIIISTSDGSPCDFATAEQPAAQPFAPSAGPDSIPHTASHTSIPRTLSEPGSNHLHNGQKFTLPRAFTNWASFQSALTSASSDSTSRRDQDFAAAMHPGSAAKLDGPLPWELPGQLRYSQDFLSICTAWQRRNPGKLYNPQQLLPPPPSLHAVDEVQEITSSSCCLEVVSYLQHMVHSLKSNKEVPDEELKQAIALLSSLIAAQEEPGPRGGRAAEATPTKADPAAALMEDAQKLHTPERLPSASPFLHSASPDMQSPFAKQVSARFVRALDPTALPVAAEQQPTLSEECLELQLATMRKEVQEDFDQQLAARTTELEALFESRVSAMRAELQEEYEARLRDKDVELEAQRQRCAELQDDLDHLLLCLGQESRKVTDLSQAMKDAGLDADPITLSIEEEYSLIDLATSY